MRRGACAILLGSLAALLPAAASAAALDWLHGQWAGRGTVHGAASEATLAIGPAIGGKFVELRYAFITKAAQPFAFEGRAYYRETPSGWSGHWFDSNGSVHALSGTVDGRTLSTEWGDAATERGRTIYRPGPDGSLDVTDAVRRKDGAWRTFATHRFRRAD